MPATSEVGYSGAFQEMFLCGITRKAGSELQFAGITEEISTLSEGDKDGESIALGNGGRVWKRTPEGDFEVTFKIYPLDMAETSAQDMVQFFLGGSANIDNTDEIRRTNEHGRDLFRVALKFSDDIGVGDFAASGTTNIGVTARRITFSDARCTSYKESFDDKILSSEVTFKGPAFNLLGSGRITRESVWATSGTILPGLDAY